MRANVAALLASLALSGAAAPLRAGCPDCALAAALDAAGRPVIVIARDGAAAAAGDLAGDAAPEWVAALDGGGLVVRSGDDGSLGHVPGVQARALAVADGRIVAALRGAGILAFDLDGVRSEFIATWTASSIAAADLDADGQDEIAAVSAGGDVVILELDGTVVASLGLGNAIAVAAGPLLRTRQDQLAVLRSGGALEIVDLVTGDATLCHFPVAGDAAAFAALPSGLLVAPARGSTLAALDAATCQTFAIDGEGLEVAHDAIFTVISEATEPPPPPCRILSVVCRPLAAGAGVEAIWELAADAGCACESISVRDSAGALLATLPGDARRATFPCERLGGATTLVVSCAGADGGATSASCAVPPCDAEGGRQRPGDCNQDGGLDISDAVCLLSHLFLGNPARLPCGGGEPRHAANTALLDSNGDAALDLSDSVYVLAFLFLGGRPPALGGECAPIDGCAELCGR